MKKMRVAVRFLSCLFLTVSVAVAGVGVANAATSYSVTGTLFYSTEPVPYTNFKTYRKHKSGTIKFRYNSVTCEGNKVTGKDSEIQVRMRKSNGVVTHSQYVKPGQTVTFRTSTGSANNTTAIPSGDWAVSARFGRRTIFLQYPCWRGEGPWGGRFVFKGTLTQ